MAAVTLSENTILKSCLGFYSLSKYITSTQVAEWLRRWT